ncbi:MAG: LPXTG cell wall anchor domain-containing protein [Propionicimonas sp.]
MLAQFTRTAAVGIAASLTLLMGGVPSAIADETVPPTSEGTSAPQSQPSDSPSPTAAEPTDQGLPPTGTPVESTEPAAEQSPTPQSSASESPAPESSEASQPEVATSPTAAADGKPATAAAPAVQPAAAALDVCAGVWVAVQAGTDQQPELDCVEPLNGQNALELVSSVHTVNAPGGYINQIDGFPENTAWDPANPVFWGFCTATAAPDTGDLSWASSNFGAADVNPPAGSVVGFRFGLWSEDPTIFCPAVSWVPVDSTTPTPTPVPPREPATGSATDAANWLAKNPADADDVDGLWQSVIGLATVNQCRFAPAVNRALEQLNARANEYTENNPGRAARLAIVASAVGLDPTDFGGVDLVARITSDLGSFSGNPFATSLAIIALTRAGAEVPDSLLQALLDSQAADGQFGFGSGSAFFPDPDSTGLAIVALSGSPRAGAAAAVSRAVAWAQGAQLPDGSWDNYVPTNTTSLLGSALELVGADAGKAQDWLKSQQLGNGALPDERDGNSADRFSTAEGLFGLTGTTYLTVSFDVTNCDPGPDEDGEGGKSKPGELPNTGASDASGALGALALGLVAVGSALVAVRQRRRA